MQTDPMTIVTVCAMASFVPMLLLRIGLLSHKYVTTGKFGSVDDSWFFGIMNYFHDRYSDYNSEEQVPTIGRAFKYLFIGTHPLTTLLDGCMYTVFAMITSGLVVLTIAFPVIIAVIAEIGLFILLLRVMRKRIAHKQQFVANLKGEQLDE